MSVLKRASSDDRTYGGERRENSRALEKYRVIVNGCRHHVPETGFVIAEVSSVGNPPPLPSHLLENGYYATPKFTIKGTSDVFLNSKKEGAAIDIAGEWKEVPSYGLQFEIKFALEVLPTNLFALEKYLSAGNLKWIGPANAKKAIAMFGMDLIDVIESSPADLADIPGITLDRAAEIADSWREKKAMFELVSFFGQYGLGEALVKKIMEFYKGTISEEIIHNVKKNPYDLIYIDGISFKTADSFALEFGFPTSSPFRLNAALNYLLQEYSKGEGHTAIPVDRWVDEAIGALGAPRSEVISACKELIANKRVLVRQIGVLTKSGYKVMNCVSTMNLARCENEVAKSLKRLIDGRSSLGDKKMLHVEKIINEKARSLDASQKLAVMGVISSGVSVMTGGPGTGKTTTLKTIVRALKDSGKSVVLAAPTGRAAKRMQEAIGVEIEGIESMTMHRRLKFDPVGGGFTYNEGNRMIGDVFVLDESSMVDIEMLNHWLKAIPTGAWVIFVGDDDQLPSVGPGAILKDMIDSGVVPSFKLTKVHRQKEGSGIAWNAAEIRDGRNPSFSGDPWVDDYSFVEVTDNDAIQYQVIEFVKGLLKSGVKHDDIQVLTPQKPGDVGVDTLNAILRSVLNPESPSKAQLEEQKFCVGERIMQIKNDYTLEIFNGDLGKVVKVHDDGGLEVVMEDEKIVSIPKDKLNNLRYGYAMTVHKSQGGERPYVLMVISKSHSFSLNRNLIYTGLTRAKTKFVGFGDPMTTVRSIRKKDELIRVTGLKVEMERVGLKRTAQA